MSKYIDAEKLIAMIRPSYEEAKNKARYAGQTGTSSACIKWDNAEFIYKNILNRIAYLQQEQPSEDLEVRKQIEELANDWHHKGFASDEDCPLCMQDLMDILWHFYELGKQAQKELMMKDAIVLDDFCIDDFSCGYYNLCVERGLTSEDKVKIIIVKED